MKLNRNGTGWNRDERNKTNENWDIIEGVLKESDDDSVISRKRTILGDIAIVHLGEGVRSPNINVKKQTLTVYEGTYLYFRKDRRRIEKDIVIDLPSDTGSLMTNIYYDIKDDVFVAIKGMNRGTTKEDHLFFCSINWASNSVNEVVNCYMTCDYTVTGQQHPKIIPQAKTGIFNTYDDVDAPNIDTNRKQITLHAPFHIIFGEQRMRRTKADGDVIIDYTDGTATILLVMDVKKETFRTLSASNIEDVSLNEIIIMSIYFNWTDQKEIKHVFFTGEYAVNGFTSEPLEFSVFQKGGSSKEPVINTFEKTLTFDKTNFLYVRNQRITINDIVIDLSDGGSSYPGNQFVLYNLVEEDFRVVNSNVYTDLRKNNDVVVMMLNWNNNNQQFIENIWFTNKYDVVGSTKEDDIKPYYFPTEDIPDYYIPSDEFPYNDFNYDSTTSQEYYQKLSELAADNAGYIKEELIGKDESGEHEIYKYVLSPELPDPQKITGKSIPKILLISGLHGSEKASVWSVYYFIKDICENWRDSKALEYLRHNIEFHIIPCTNPWGLNNTKRSNVNDVDLNRNFDTPDWVEEEESNWGTILKGGTEPFSEKETQYIRDMILDNLDAVYFCDYHTDNGSGDDQNKLFWISPNEPKRYNTDDLVIAAKSHISKTTRNYIKNYNQPDNEGLFGYIREGSSGAYSKTYAQRQGLLASTTEILRKFPDEEDYYSPNAIKACTEYIGNWLLTVLKQLKNNY